MVRVGCPARGQHSLPRGTQAVAAAAAVLHYLIDDQASLVGEAIVPSPSKSPVTAAGLGLTGFRLPAEVIMLAVRWYLRLGLSYRDVEELLVEAVLRSTTSPFTAR